MNVKSHRRDRAVSFSSHKKIDVTAGIESQLFSFFSVSALDIVIEQ